MTDSWVWLKVFIDFQRLQCSLLTRNNYKMDTVDHTSTALLTELKEMFPEIPEDAICDSINQSSKDKEECIKFLTRIKEDYLFVCQSPISSVLAGRDRFTKMNINDDTDNNDSKEMLKSEDIYIPEGTLNFKYPLPEEKKNVTLKQNSNHQIATGKNAVQSAPVIPSASHPFGLLDNGNFSASGQREFSSNANMANSSLSRDTSKWNNGNEPAAQFPRQNFFSRLYSYPIHDPRNAHFQNIPLPSLYNYNLTSEDYMKPLHISVSAPQLLTPSYSPAHSSISLLSSSSPNSQIHHSPVPPHLVPAYTSPSVLEATSSISTHLTPSYTSPLPAVLNPSPSVSHVPPFHYPSQICPPHQYTSTSQSPTSVTVTGLHYPYDNPATEDQLREQIDARKTSLHTNAFQQTNERFPKEFTSRTYLPKLPTSFNQYNSQLTDQISPFMHNTSCAKAEENQDTDYVKALLAHQRNSYELIRNELLRMQTLRYTLRKDVSSREEELLQIKQQQKFPNVEQIQKLKEEIIKLRVERDCLAMEMDFHAKGQESPNGIEDNFYKNIFTGPKGPIPPAPSRTIAQSQNNFVDRRDEDDRNKWNCRKCTYANHPDLIDCEMCETRRNTIN